MDRRLLAALFRPGSRLSLEADASDADLLARFAATGDDAAFAEVVRRHGPLVWGVCRNLLPNSADAEDAFQATFLALVQSPRAVRRAASLPGFLHGVAVRVAAKLRRGAVRRKQREAKAAVPEADSPVPDSAWNDVYAVIQDEVRRLPASLRAAFLVCEVGGVSHAEAARQLGWKPGTLSGTLARAKQRLIVRLGARGIGPAAAVALVGGVASTGPAAVPWRLVEAVSLFPKAAAGVVPAAITKLALEGLTVGVSYTKLLAVAVVAAGGLGMSVGPAVLPVADAQAPGEKAAKPPTAAPAPPPTSLPPPTKPAEGAKPMGVPNRPQWEYRLVRKPDGGADIAAFMAQRGRDGWEYAGLLAGDFSVSKNADLAAESVRPVGQVMGPVELMVFKRPVPQVVRRLEAYDVAGIGPRIPSVPPLPPTPAEAALKAEVEKLRKELRELKQGLPNWILPKAAPSSSQLRPSTRPDPVERVHPQLDLPTPRAETRLLPPPVALPLPPARDLIPPTPMPEPRPSAELPRIAPPKPEPEPEPISFSVEVLGAQEAAAVVEAMLGKLDAAQGGPVRVRAVPTAGMVFGATSEVAKRIDGAIRKLEMRALDLVKRKEEMAERMRQADEAKRSAEWEKAEPKPTPPRLPSPVK